MRTRPHSAFVQKLKALRCPKCGAKVNPQRKRCKRCSKAFSSRPRSNDGLRAGLRQRAGGRRPRIVHRPPKSYTSSGCACARRGFRVGFVLAVDPCDVPFPADHFASRGQASAVRRRGRGWDQHQAGSGRRPGSDLGLHQHPHRRGAGSREGDRSHPRYARPDVGRYRFGQTADCAGRAGHARHDGHRPRHAARRRGTCRAGGTFRSATRWPGLRHAGHVCQRRQRGGLRRVLGRQRPRVAQHGDVHAGHRRGRRHHHRRLAGRRREQRTARNWGT